VDESQVEANALGHAVLPSLSAPLVTSWPCFTEAMYFAQRAGGFPLQRVLWNYANPGVLSFHDPNEEDRSRMQALMQQYRSLPMDMADASLVATAEALNLRRVFTLDSDFDVYRFRDRDPFDVAPDASRRSRLR
jgi:predicted nucleic acid-binding protein